MIAELSRAIASAVRSAQLSSTPSSAVRKKLIAIVIDPMFKTLTLNQVHELRREGLGQMIDEVIREMALAQLKAVFQEMEPAPQAAQGRHYA